MKKSWHQHSQVAPKEERTGPDGFVYDSKTEYQRYCYLKLLERAGEIRNLRRQPKFELVFGCGSDQTAVMVGKNRTKTAVYTPDFCYEKKECYKSNNLETGVILWPQVIEDVKGYSDENSKFRIRVFEAAHQCNVTIVKKKRGGQWIEE